MEQLPSDSCYIPLASWDLAPPCPSFGMSEHEWITSPVSQLQSLTNRRFRAIQNRLMLQHLGKFYFPSSFSCCFSCGVIDLSFQHTFQDEIQTPSSPRLSPSQSSSCLLPLPLLLFHPYGAKRDSWNGMPCRRAPCPHRLISSKRPLHSVLCDVTSVQLQHPSPASLPLEPLPALLIPIADFMAFLWATTSLSYISVISTQQASLKNRIFLSHTNHLLSLSCIQ